MSLNKGKAKAKPKMRARGDKPAVMDRREYNVAISGQTMAPGMYNKGGKVKKYQAGKQVAKSDSTAIYAQRTRDALKAMSPNKPGSEEAYENAKRNQLNYENRKNKTNFELPKTAPRSVNRAGGTTRKYKSGGSKFPDLNNDGEITQADILKGRGVFKKGGSAKKKK